MWQVEMAAEMAAGTEMAAEITAEMDVPLEPHFLHPNAPDCDMPTWRGAAAASRFAHCWQVRRVHTRIRANCADALRAV